MAKSVKGHKKLKIVLCIIIPVIILGWLFLFTERRIYLEDLYGPPEVKEENGRITFSFPITDGGISIHGGKSEDVIYDYDNGIRYKYYIYNLNATRHDTYFRKGMFEDWFFILEPDGREYQSLHYPEEKHTREEYEKSYGLMKVRYLRVYFPKKDGTYELLWELENADEIIKQTGAEINEDPSFYVFHRGDR